LRLEFDLIRQTAVHVSRLLVITLRMAMYPGARKEQETGSSQANDTPPLKTSTGPCGA
jgi:hypothetical protein